MITVIIPTLNAEKEIGGLIESLRVQTLKPEQIIVVDSQSDDRTVAICDKYENVKVIPILRKDFDHGGTRDMAIRNCESEFVVLLTQDAMPQNPAFLERLVEPFKDPGVAAVTGRHLPRTDATRMEKLVRRFNYPAESHVRSREDLERMGIKTYFFSDVCSAYRRDTYLELGGFEHPVKTNEDMFFAAKAIQNGYKIAYAADAAVIHSHNLTLKEQYRRNYALGIEMQRHKHLLGPVSQESEGIKLVKYVSLELLKKGHILSFVHFGFDCCARLLGSRMGRKAAVSMGNKKDEVENEENCNYSRQ